MSSRTSNDSQLFQSLTLVVPGLVWVCDEQGYVRFNNAHWTDFTGMPRERGLAHGWLDAIHPADAASFRARLPLKLTTGDSYQAEMRVRRHDGVYHRHLFKLRYVAEGEWIGCAIDAHEWLTTTLRDATQGNILEMVIAGDEINVVLSELCKAAERQIPGATCSVLLVDEENERFISGVAPGLPDNFMALIPKTRIGRGVGSCGPAAFLRRDVISVDIDTDPHWDGWRDLIRPLGYRACWSKPIFASKGEVIATFGFYFRERRAPTADELQELARLRGLASLSIERARMLDALRESEEHYRYTVEQNPQIPWTADAEGRVLSVSSRWVEFTGISQIDALGNGWLKALHPDDVTPAAESWDEALSTRCPVDINYRLRRSTGEYRWSRARATPRLGENNKVLLWYGTVEDVHEQHLANEKLKVQAFQDDLTGLPNRRRFVDELRMRLRVSNEPVGLMVLDLDDFKVVNDRYGHLTGDALLRLVARYLQRAVEPHEFIARLGGDEFAVICQQTPSESGLLERAKSIEASLDSRLKGNVKSRSCRPSIGCALGFGGENSDEVFRRADLALYAAKSSGKGIVRLFDPQSVAQRREGPTPSILPVRRCARTGSCRSINLSFGCPIRHLGGSRLFCESVIRNKVYFLLP